MWTISDPEEMFTNNIAHCPMGDPIGGNFFKSTGNFTAPGGGLDIVHRNPDMPLDFSVAGGGNSKISF
jgi:hypothetical protein